MKIVYLSDAFHHHQKPLADILYNENQGDYWFVETNPELFEERRKLGFTKYKVPYTIKYKGNEAYVDNLIIEADVVICGEAPAKLVKKRVKIGKLTFRDDERRYKGLIKYLKYPVYTWYSLIFNKGYLLAASAYGARDYVISGMNPAKCFRWGYFTEVKDINDVSEYVAKKQSDTTIKKKKEVSLLWVGRLVRLKHPEMAIEVARKLKNDGLVFHLNIIGPGPMESKIIELIKEYDLGDCVSLLGQKGQDEVRSYMEKSEIFLFTSDEYEGWGMTLCESMASACAPIASHAAGASLFLVRDGVNGFVFKSRDSNSLYSKVKFLIENEEMRTKLCIEAYKTMHEIWNCKTAASNLIQLIEALKEGKETPIKEGPCSQAPIINHTWM